MTTPSTTPQSLPYNFRFAQTDEYAPRVTAAINAQIKVAGAAIDKLGAMIVTAYAQNVADQMGYETWSEYVEAELVFDGFKPDAPARKLLVAMFREAGMEYAEVAPVVKASVRTVKNDAADAGLTTPNAAKGNRPRAEQHSSRAGAGRVSPTGAVNGSSAPASAPAPRGVTVVTDKVDAKVIEALHAQLDGLPSYALEGLAAYIGTVLRQRNKAQAIAASRVASPAKPAVPAKPAPAKRTGLRTAPVAA